MNESIATGEKYGRWELISGNKKDKEDLRILDMAAHGEEHRGPEEEQEFPPGSGMILRQGDTPIGFTFFDVDDYSDKRVLFISFLFVLPENRNPTLMAQFVRELKKYAQDQNATHVGWSSGSREMDRVTRRINPDANNMLLPLTEFDVGVFTRGI